MYIYYLFIKHLFMNTYAIFIVDYALLRFAFIIKNNGMHKKISIKFILLSPEKSLHIFVLFFNFISVYILKSSIKGASLCFRTFFFLFIIAVILIHKTRKLCKNSFLFYALHYVFFFILVY